jgi:NADPH:quinone reductase-like Zn-dependent oxidoreductase
VVLDRDQENVVAEAVRRLGPLDAIAALQRNGLLVRSLSGLKDGGRAGSIVELRGDFEEAIDRNLSLHGLLVQPDSLTLDRLAVAVERGAPRPILDAVVDPGSIVHAHHRVESGHRQGRVVLRMTKEEH